MEQTLQPLYEMAYLAHRNTSFDPDIRAKNIVKNYSQELDSDLQKINDEAPGSYWCEHYKDKYI